MKGKRRYLYLILVLLLTNCVDSPYKTRAIEMSHSVDSLRINYDLPLIPENFILEDYGLDVALWSTKTKQFPKYWTKNIYWDSLGVFLERNYFYKSDTERMQVYCIYRQPKDIDTFGVCHFYQKNLTDSGTFLHKRQADSILNNWGLK